MPTAEHTIRKVGYGRTAELEEIVRLSTGRPEGSVDLRLPHLSVAEADGRAIAVLSLDRPSGELVVRAFHFRPEDRDAHAPALRERIRAGAAAEDRKVVLTLANEDAWAAAFLEALVPKARRPEVTPAVRSEGPPDPDPAPASFPVWTLWMNLAGGAAIVAVVAFAIAGAFRDGLSLGASVFALLFGLPLLVAALADPFRARGFGAIRLPLRRRLGDARYAPLIGGVAGLIGYCLGVSEPWATGTAITGLAAGTYFFVFAIVRRCGVREGGVTLPNRMNSVPWSEIRCWRRVGTEFTLELRHWRPGLRDDPPIGASPLSVRFEVEPDQADAFEAILREKVGA